MKRKLDFITNSSSTSFIAWGVSISEQDLRDKYGKDLFKIYKQLKDKDKHEKAIKQGAFMTVPSDVDKEQLEQEYLEFIEDEDFFWSVETVVENSGLVCRSMPYEEELMIGKCPFSIGEDQTLKEFKLEICEKFKQCGIDVKPEELDQIEECWMNN